MSSTPSSERSGKRRHIVETAYGLFKRAGFHATGIDRIIAEADVAKMTMYRNFPSKEQLIIEVLEYRAQRFENQLDRLTASPGTPEQKIDAILDWYRRWFLRPDFHGCLFAHALAEYAESGTPIFEAAAKQKADLRRRMADILAVKAPVHQAESLAAAILMLIEGATLMAEMGQGEEAIRDARRAASVLIAAAGRGQ